MTRDDILATLDDYADAYCAKDIEAMMSVFDDSDDISVIGTGADELCSGRSEVRELFLRNFGAANARRFEWGWKQVSVAADCAVIAIALTIVLEMDGEEIQVPLRWTVALRHNGSRWVWVHRHASTSASNQSSGKAYPTGSD